MGFIFVLLFLPVIVAIIGAYFIAKKLYSITKPQGENKALIYSIIAFITSGGLIAFALYYIVLINLDFGR